MPQVIIYNQQNGKVGILSPSQEALAQYTMDQIASQYLENTTKYWIVDSGELPASPQENWILSQTGVLTENPQVSKVFEIVVTPWQIRQALNELGLRAQVENLVKTTTNQDIKDGWEFATEWREFNPIIAEIASQLHLTQSQIHAIFVLAKQKNA